MSTIDIRCHLGEKFETIKTGIISFVCKPLLDFKKDPHFGDRVFEELYQPRRMTTEQLYLAQSLKYNINIIGNPGEGKSCFLHRIMLHSLNNPSVFPILLDYRDLPPRESSTLIIKFMTMMVQYFELIKRPINLAEKTTEHNMRAHCLQIQEHLSKVEHRYIMETKRPVIILDDFDYMDKDLEYISILKTYFAPFAFNEKAGNGVRP